MPSLRSVTGTLQTHFGLSYSDRFVQAMSRALAVQPGERPQSVHDMVQDMGLQAPAGLNKFDWRSALGATLLPAAPHALAPDDRTQARTQTQTTLPPASPARPRVRARVWAGSALALLLAVLGAWVGLSGSDPLVGAPDPAATPNLVLNRPALPEAGATDPADPRPSVPASAEAPVMPPAGTEAGSPVGTELTRAAVVPDRPASPASAPRPLARPAKPAAPKPLCPDAGVFARPVCLFRECLKKENYKHPICVESRRNTTNPSESSP
jgi:non-specific serine/threonine protein kinase